MATLAILLALVGNYPSVLGGFLTYYSGDDAAISVSQCGVETKRFLERTPYVDFEEDFSHAGDMAEWCTNNGWSTEGDAPAAPGRISLSLSPDGGLCWHNWQHPVDGSSVDCSLYHSVGPFGGAFALEATLRSDRLSPSRIPGSPALHVCISLYDTYGSLIFTDELVYVENFVSAMMRIYSSQLNATIGASVVHLRMWQNSSGAFISHDNGSSVLRLGSLATSPSTLEIRFHSDEVNVVNGQSDYEYRVFIDRISLRSCSDGSIDFSGLQPGEWHLVSGEGEVIAQSASNHCTAFTVQANESIDGFLSSIRSYTYSKTGLFMPNSLLTFNREGGYFSLSEYGMAQFNLSDSLSSSEGWLCPSGKVQHYTYTGPTSTGSAVSVSLASDTYIKSYAEPWLQRTVDVWASAIDIDATFGIELGRGTLTHAQLSSVDIVLTNGSVITLSVQRELSVGTLLDQSFHFDLGALLPIRSVRLNLSLEAFNYARLSISISDMSVTWYGYNGMIVRGLPESGILQVYDGNALAGSAICDGSDLKVALGASLPRMCRLEVTYSPSSQPIASYNALLGWCDRLDLANGDLSRSDTGVSMVNLTRASECDNGSGWSYRWNLTTGGTMPAYSSQSGFLIMRQDSLTSKGTLPLIDAYYWFDYPLNLIGNDFSIAVSADAAFYFYTNGIFISKYCELSLYAVSDGVTTLIARSQRSLNPQLLAMVPFSSPDSNHIEKLVVEVHAYARSSIYSVLQSFGNAVRIDYLRINASSMPDGYPNVLVAGLSPGQYVLYDGSKWWANRSGSVAIPLVGTSWPSTQHLQIFDSSECYHGPFLSDGAYCPVEERARSAAGNIAFIMASTPCYSYCEELKLTSVSRGIDKSGMFVLMGFQYCVFDNCTALEPRKISLYVDGMMVNVVRDGVCSYSVRFNIYPGTSSVRLCAHTESGIMMRCTVIL